ncbi:hypothetical protein EV363DRAFT_1296311 [Boletus edulis]|nr:hypothetical protein EV363DRAFT_1296311 [Boletus edulis]
MAGALQTRSVLAAGFRALTLDIKFSNPRSVAYTQGHPDCHLPQAEASWGLSCVLAPDEEKGQPLTFIELNDPFTPTTWALSMPGMQALTVEAMEGVIPGSYCSGFFEAGMDSSLRSSRRTAMFCNGFHVRSWGVKIGYQRTVTQGCTYSSVYTYYNGAVNAKDMDGGLVVESDKTQLLGDFRPLLMSVISVHSDEHAFGSWWDFPTKSISRDVTLITVLYDMTVFHGRRVRDSPPGL